MISLPRGSWRGIALLSLPTLAAAALIALAAAKTANQLARGEELRVKAVYQEVAEDLKDDPAAAEWNGERERSWKPYKMKPGRWGYEPRGEKTFVWYEEGDAVRGKIVPAEPRADYPAICFAVAVFLVLLLVLITSQGVRYFLRYNRERDDFLGATAHDLRTPLASLQFLIGSNDAEARLACQRMVCLVENVIAFLRLGGRRREPEFKEFDLVAAYREAYAVFREDFAEASSGEVVLDAPERVPVFADETMTVQILWNLLGNALKYASAAGRVSAAIRCEDGQALFALADEGPGLGSVSSRKIFSRYFRSPAAKTSGKGGFGIGLCTSREFARAMGGELSVAANSPRGCIFTLRLQAR